MYQLRFLIAAELRHAFDHFGGFASQISHLGTVVTLSITEHIGIALAYRRAINQKLQEKARHRIPGPGPYIELLAEQNFTLLEQAKKEYALSSAPLPATKLPAVGKVKGKGKKGQKGQRGTDTSVASLDTYQPSTRAPSRRRSRSRSPVYYRRQTFDRQPNQWPANANRQQPQNQHTHPPKFPQGRGQNRRQN